MQKGHRGGSCAALRKTLSWTDCALAQEESGLWKRPTQWLLRTAKDAGLAWVRAGAAVGSTRLVPWV